MKTTFTHSNLPQLLLKARESVFRHFRPIINHVDLTEQQWRILRTVYEHEQLEPRELCDLCQIMSSSMAGVLARMEEKELISRTRFPDDQRRVLVKPSNKGKEIVQQIAPLIAQQYQYLENALGADLVQQMYSLTEKLIEKEKQSVIKHVDLS